MIYYNNLIEIGLKVIVLILMMSNYYLSMKKMMI